MVQPILMRPEKLREPDKFDVSIPLNEYYRGQANKRANESSYLDNEKKRVEIDSFKSAEPARRRALEIQARVKELESDEAFKQAGINSITGINPDAPKEEFDKAVVSGLVGYEKQLVQQFKFSPEAAGEMVQKILSSGRTTPEGIKAIQTELGIRKEPKTQIIGGKLVTLSNGSASVQDIPGLETEDKPDTQVGKLIRARDKLPIGSPDRLIYEQAIAKETKVSGGQSLTVDPDGTVNFSQGGGEDLSKATKNKVQQGMLDSSNMVVRLNDTKNSLKSEMLTAGGKFEMSKLALLEKIDPGSLTDEDRKYIAESSEFYTNALTNLNKTLNELSGAAVSVQEFERISSALPNPGKKGFLNVLSGDSITEFTSKLETGIEKGKMAIARYNYINNNGLTIGKNRNGEITGFFDNEGKTISISSMPKIMNDRANEIGQQVLSENNGISIEEARGIVKDRIAQEFGLTVQ